MAVAGLFWDHRLALPAAELIQDRWPATPVGVPTRMGEHLCDLLPAVLRLGLLHVKGLGDRLARDRQLQRQTPGMQRCFGPGSACLSRVRLPIMRVGQEGGDNRRDERGMQERLHGAGLLGIDLVQAVHRFVQPDAHFDLPAWSVRELPPRIWTI
jgi:hypothetical protein